MPAPDATNAISSGKLLLLLLLAAAALRGGEVWRQHPLLLDDRDAYLAIGRNLADGHGFGSSPEATPSAFRPPLYPCLIGLGIRIFRIETETGLKVWVALLNLACGLATVWLAVQLALRWFGPRAAFLTGVWVCCDPLLIHNTALPMTETLFTFLFVALIGRLELPSATDRPPPTRRRQLAQGILFGLCALCRPTVWIFGGLWGACALIQWRRRTGWSATLRRAVLPAVTAIAVVAPWVVRNAVAFGAWIPMTTHGGYTLLLANNPVFDREVVSQSWRNVWSEESLLAWQDDLELQMQAAGIARGDELARDRWMAEQAREFIRTHPAAFVRGCAARTLRFWNIVPLRTGDAPLPRAIVLGLWAYYATLFGAIVFGVAARRVSIRSWAPIAVALVSFSAVHAVYWSNLRMRAPLEPVLAVVAAASVTSRRGENSRRVPTTDGEGCVS